MENLLITVVALLFGAALGYLIRQVSTQRTYEPKSVADGLRAELESVRLESASKISKSELSEHYIPLSQHHSLVEQLTSAQAKLEAQEQRIVDLTGSVEQRLSRDEVSQRFVPKESHDLVQETLGKAQSELQGKQDEFAKLNAVAIELESKNQFIEEKLNTFMTEWSKLESASKAQFQNLANEILEGQRKLFIETNKTEILNIMDPLKTDLTSFREKVEATRKEDIQDITTLKVELERLNKLNVQLSDDAKHLAKALKSDVKLQGNWGEDRLNLILETEGLVKYIDYSREDHFKTEDASDKNKRTDFILRLPDGKSLIIDSKVSLNAYTDYYNADDEPQRADALKRHLKSIEGHIETLSSKQYHALAGLTTPDYVFMFIPIESALTLALNANQDLISYAATKKIVLVTPSTLIACLKIVRMLWQQDSQVKNVEEIFRQCGALYDKFVSFLEDMEKVETSLNAAQKAYRGAIDSLSTGSRKGSTIIGRIESIRKLEAKTNKRLPQKFSSAIEMLPNDGDDELDGENQDA